MEQRQCYTGEQVDGFVSSIHKRIGIFGMTALPLDKARTAIAHNPSKTLGMRDNACTQQLVNIPFGSGYASLPYRRWALVFHSLNVGFQSRNYPLESRLRLACLPGILPEDADAIAFVELEETSGPSWNDSMDVCHLKLTGADEDNSEFSTFDAGICLTEKGDIQRGYPGKYSEYDMAVAEICRLYTQSRPGQGEPKFHAVYDFETLSAAIPPLMEELALVFPHEDFFSLGQIEEAMRQANWCNVEDLYHLRPHCIEGALANRITQFSARFRQARSLLNTVTAAVRQKKRYSRPDKLVLSTISEMGLDRVFESKSFLQLSEDDNERARYAFALFADNPEEGIDKACSVARKTPDESRVICNPPCFSSRALYPTSMESVPSFEEFEGHISPYRWVEDAYLSNIPVSPATSNQDQDPGLPWAVAVASIPSSRWSSWFITSFIPCLRFLGLFSSRYRGIIPFASDVLSDADRELISRLEAQGKLGIVYDASGILGGVNCDFKRYIVEKAGSHFELSQDAPISDTFLSGFDDKRLDSLSASLVYDDLSKSEKTITRRDTSLHISPKLICVLSDGLIEYTGRKIDYTSAMVDDLRPLRHVAQLRDRTEKAMRLLLDLEEIWHHAVGWIPSMIDAKGASLIRHIGEKRGIDKYVSAYKSGVPLEDLLS